MMTREQYYLTCLAEESVEVAQRADKAVRFGLEEVQPDQPLTNRQRLEQELGDLLGVCDMLGIEPDKKARSLKAAKVFRYAHYSSDLGMVERS